MNNTFSLQQISRASNLDANLISRQNKLNPAAGFMWMKYEKPKLKQSEIANQVDYSSSTLQRYRNDINMLSTKRTQPKNTKNELKRLQILILTTIHIANMTLNDLQRPQMTLKQLKQIQN